MVELNDQDIVVEDDFYYIASKEECVEVEYIQVRKNVASNDQRLEVLYYAELGVLLVSKIDCALGLLGIASVTLVRASLESHFCNW